MKLLLRCFLWTAAVVLIVVLLLALLVIRPSHSRIGVPVDPKEEQAMNMAACKIGIALRKNSKDPEREVTICFSREECAAMLSMIARFVSHLAEEDLEVVALENRGGRIVSCVEVKLPLGVVPVRIAAKGEIRDKELKLELLDAEAGAIPLPTGLLQKRLSVEIGKIEKKREYRAIIAGISRLEFQSDGSLVLEATPATCLRLLKKCSD